MNKTENLPELTIKYKIGIDRRTKISSPEDAFKLASNLFDTDKLEYQEEFLILLLNSAKETIGYSKIANGGRSCVIVDVQMIFQVALLSHADSVILFHNHPSGYLKESVADINLTKRVKDGLRLLGMNLDDHIIITASDYLSMRSKNLF